MQKENKALLVAIRILTIRDHSKSDIKRKLNNKKFDSQDIEETIDKLDKMKLLDDEKFAKMYISSKMRKFWGPRRVLLGLQGLGVEKQIIEEAMNEIDWKEVLKKALDSNKTKEPKSLSIKMERLGFPKGMILKAMKCEETDD